MSKVRVLVKSYEDTEIDSKQALEAIEFFILEKVPSLKDCDRITALSGMKQVITDIDYHTDDYTYEDIGPATEEELNAHNLINSLRKLIHGK